MLQQKSLHMTPGGGAGGGGFPGLGLGGRPGDIVSPTSTDLSSLHHRPGNPLGPIVGLTLANHHHHHHHHNNNNHHHTSFKSPSNNNKNSSLHRFSVEALAGTGPSSTGINSDAHKSSLNDHSDNESINSWDEDIPIDSDSDDDIPLDSPIGRVDGDGTTESDSSRGATSPKNLRTRDK